MMTRLSAVSLFSGAGGMDYGFEAAGFETAVAVDVDTACCRTLRANREFPVIERDLLAVSSTDLMAAAGLRSGELGLLHGGPPCQPFSKAAYWSRGKTLRLDDPRAGTLAAYMRVVEDLLPAVFVLENVHGISYSGKEEGFQFLCEATEAINRRCATDYHLSWSVLNAAEYGVPQQRKRFILVGRRDGRQFQFPPRTHTDIKDDELLGSTAVEPLRTTWDALGDLPSEWPDEDLAVRGRWARLLPSIPEGENYLWHTARKGGLPLFGWRTRYWSFLLKLSKGLPSWTVQAQPGPAIGPFHWKSRHLSMRELARIQTFPDDVTVLGSRRLVQMQLGNAVPSLLAEVLGREILQQVFGEEVPTPLRLLPPRRVPVPTPEAVAEVPNEYLSLVGHHAEHPGTGKGRAAAERDQTDALKLVPGE